MTNPNARQYFQILTSSGVPIYRQLMDQIKIQIAIGILERGKFLPSVRQVAEDLAVNPMTVSKAYSQLEKEGVLEFVRGQGMLIRETAVSKKNLQKREDDLTPLLAEVVMKAQQLSLEPDKVIQAFKSLWKESKHG